MNPLPLLTISIILLGQDINYINNFIFFLKNKQKNTCHKGVINNDNTLYFMLPFTNIIMRGLVIMSIKLMKSTLTNICEGQ
jgi:hypothetical protein